MLQNIRVSLRRRQKMQGPCARGDVNIGQKYPEAQGNGKRRPSSQHHPWHKSVGKRICGRFRSINAHAEKKRQNSSELEIFWVFQNSSNGYCSQWRYVNKKRKQLCMSKNWSCSWQWISSKIHQQCSRSENSAKNTDIITSGAVVNFHSLWKWAEGFASVEEIICRSFSQGCQEVPPARLQIRLQQRHRSTQEIPYFVLQSPEVRVRVVRHWETSGSSEKDEDTPKARGNRLHDIPESLEDFRENLLEDKSSDTKERARRFFSRIRNSNAERSGFG